jgi:hypothetical protein
VGPIDRTGMAVWIAATVGQYDVLHAYSTEPSSTEIGDAERSEFLIRINTLVGFLMEVQEGKVSSPPASRKLVGDLLNDFNLNPYRVGGRKQTKALKSAMGLSGIHVGLCDCECRGSNAERRRALRSWAAAS